MQAEERVMLSLLPHDLSGKFVLDAGCGTGRYVIHALRRGATLVTGVDSSPEMLDRAKVELDGLSTRSTMSDSGDCNTGMGPQLLLGSLEALPVFDQWSDVTICALTIGHLPTLRPALAELQRVTKAGGVILCSDFHPIGHSLGWQRAFSVNGQRYIVRHTPHSPGDWQHACSALGLEIVSVLEPRLDQADIPSSANFDAAALSLPVAIVYFLLKH